MTVLVAGLVLVREVITLSCSLVGPILSTTSYPQYYRDLTTTEKSIQDIMGMTKCPASLKDKPFDVGLCEENENADILPTVMGVLSKIQEASTLESECPPPIMKSQETCLIIAAT